MKGIYSDILEAVTQQKKLLAVLIDPDKFCSENTKSFLKKINASVATHIFVGGSEVEDHTTESLVAAIKEYTSLPIVLFPGDITQITNKADALLFLSLISGRNPDYLIDKHVQAVSKLKQTQLEIIPTGYILIENGKETAVQRVTRTQPMLKNNRKLIANTALAGEFLGMKLIYLEAGSGAIEAISNDIISAVKQEVSLPVIVGGGIRSKKQIDEAYRAGADMVVIGTAFEENESFFRELIN